MIPGRSEMHNKHDRYSANWINKCLTCHLTACSPSCPVNQAAEGHSREKWCTERSVTVLNQSCPALSRAGIIAAHSQPDWLILSRTECLSTCSLLPIHHLQSLPRDHSDTTALIFHPRGAWLWTLPMVTLQRLIYQGSKAPSALAPLLICTMNAVNDLLLSSTLISVSLQSQSKTWKSP